MSGRQQEQPEESNEQTHGADNVDPLPVGLRLHTPVFRTRPTVKCRQFSPQKWQHFLSQSWFLMVFLLWLLLARIFFPARKIKLIIVLFLSKQRSNCTLVQQKWPTRNGASSNKVRDNNNKKYWTMPVPNHARRVSQQFLVQRNERCESSW